MQSMFFRNSPNLSPAVSAWHAPVPSEASHATLQLTGQLRTISGNIGNNPYITMNHAARINQENNRELPGRSRQNPVKVVDKAQGRPILGMNNQEHKVTSKAEKSKMSDNGSGWTIEYNRDRSGYSAILKRPRPSTPDVRKDKGPQHNNQRYFKPVQNSPSKAVELHVTNLDQNIDSLELTEMLLAAFKEHIMVVHLSIFVQSDGNLAASVKVRSVQDAQYAISQLHRRKVGHKRIMIAYAHSGSSQNFLLIRSQIYSLLSEVPGCRLPLFKFRDLFESRYLTSISISELYRMRDVCIIKDENSGRTIYLNPEYRNTPSPRINTTINEAGQQNMEVSYCVRHGHKQELSCDKGWAEQELPTLPNVRVKLSLFSDNIQALIHSHNDFLPLASLMDCYAAEFEPLTADESGVPLEHLVTWVPNVELALNIGCVKYLRCTKNKPPPPEKADDGMKKCTSPSLANELSLFSRELVDLLKTQPKNNQLMFNRFIPAYHHHFGRQCRVADYGFTKLIDLFEALPHVIQVIGEGNKRIVTLARRAQMRRFTSDLIRVLKSQVNKQLKISDLNALFDPVDYGLCYLEDLLEQLSENIVVVSGTGPSKVIGIPKREQTAEEMERTKRFALEVIELMSHAPQCSMFFSKFIPAYHHHYGHQCRVSDYGFTKLIELFEAIPHIVKIEDTIEGERRVTLTNDKKIAVLNNQIVELVNASYPPGLPISLLMNTFLRQFGYALKPAAYGCDDLHQLIDKLQNSVKVVNVGNEPVLTPANKSINKPQLHQLSLRVFRVLMVKEDAKMTFSQFYQAYKSLYNELCSLELLEQLKDFVKITCNSTVTVELTSLQLFARSVYELLYISNGRISRSSFESTYANHFGKPIRPDLYNCQSVNALVNAISHVVIQEEEANHTLVLNKELEYVGIPLPSGLYKSLSNQDSVKTFQNGSSNELQNGREASHQRQKALVKGLENSQNHDAKESNTSAEWEHLFHNNNSSYNYNDQVPVINLPEPCDLPDPEECASLLSPYKTLLPATVNPFCYSTPHKKRIIYSRPFEQLLHQSYFTNSKTEPVPVINLPEPCVLPDPEECASLLSPYKTLLPATVNPFCYSTPRKKRIVSPHPSELPLPQPCFTNSNPELNAEEEDSADSGLVTSAVDLVPDCDSGSNSSNGTVSNNGKRKIRVAAQFNMPLD